MKKKSGFTIIELLIVVIIIGVLATIAVPQFTKAVEKTQMSRAVNMLGLFKKAQAMNYAENQMYVNANTDVANLTQHIEEIVLAPTQGEWTYTIGGSSVYADYTVTATRLKGSWSDQTPCTITLVGNTTSSGTISSRPAGAATASSTCVKQY